MKKIISLLLALTLVFSLLALTSCKKGDDDDNSNTVATLAGKTPEQLYELSKTKLKEATSYSVNASQVITMQLDGEDMTMNQTVISTVNGDNSYSKVTSDEMGELLNMEVWYVDGMLYSSMTGAKVKAPIDKDTYMEEYMGTDPKEDTLLDIPTSWFADVKFEKEGDKWVLNFLISGEKYNEMFDNLDLGGDIVGDVVYKIYFDADGNIEKMITTFDMTTMGVKAHCDSVAYITIGNVTVNPPADADSYILTTMP